MLRSALDFWMEPAATYSPIIKVGQPTFDHYDDKKDSDAKAPNDNGDTCIIDSNRSSSRICWFHLPDHPLSFQWFLTIRGSENFHLYLWLIKDLAWAQSWYYCGHIFGSLAVIWSVYILSHAARERNTNEIFTGVAQTFWLMANVWWMTGDLHDHAFPDSPKWYARRTMESGHMMQAALCWLGIYYLIVKPFRLLGCDNPEALSHYDNTGLSPRFSRIFSTWREYENCHILFWLGKDCAWNGLIPSMWIIFVLPTLLIACDFVFSSLFSEKLLVDHAHYFSQLLWVLANALWAGGEIFRPEYDEPYPLIDGYEARYTLRWYSSWVLIVACVPVLVMYGMWTYHTYKGTIKDNGQHIGLKGHESSTVTSDGDCLQDGAPYHLQPVPTSDPANKKPLRRSDGGDPGLCELGDDGGEKENRRQNQSFLATPYHTISQPLLSKMSSSSSASNNMTGAAEYHSNGDDVHFTDNPMSFCAQTPTPSEANGNGNGHASQPNIAYTAPTLAPTPSSLPLSEAEIEEINMNEFEVMEL